MSIAIDRGLSAVTAAKAGVTAADAATATSSTSTAASSSTITSSDFMTLLVTEMKNQDPTQPTDPTQYVQQLVGVNSLQQLIAINQGINGTTTTTATKG